MNILWQILIHIKIYGLYNSILISITIIVNIYIYTDIGGNRVLTISSQGLLIKYG